MQESADSPPEIQQLQKANKVLVDENRLLREQVNLLTHKLYGRQTEKSSALADVPGQGELFILIEDEEPDEDGNEQDESGEDQEDKPKREPRKRGKRRPFPPHYRRTRVIHDLPEEDKICACGACKKKIGEITSEQFKLIPAVVEVLQDVRLKYACPACEGVDEDGPTVAIAPPPTKFLPKSIAHDSLLVEILVNKFVDCLPFYRQEKRFARLGFKIDRTTQANWVRKTAAKCRVLINMMKTLILHGNYIGADETTIRVMNERGRLNKTLSYIWVIRGGPPDQPIIWYHYRPTRAAGFIKDFLKDYQGYVQTDGYIGYAFLDHQSGIIHLGCWVHVRRKFTEAIKARAKKKPKGKKTHAEVGLSFISKLYAIERLADREGLTLDERRALRQDKAKPILEAFKVWLDEMHPKVMTGSLLGKAITYALGQWHRLSAYLEQGYLKPDNNDTENVIRPYVLGRKNWMMAGSPEGAEANATMYSLVETAIANGWEPRAYLTFLFERLPLAETNEMVYELLPCVAKPPSATFSEADNPSS